MQLRTAFPAAVLLGSMVGVVGASLGSAERMRHLLTPPRAAEAELVSAAAAAPVERVTWDLPVVRNERVDRFVTMFRDEQADRMALYLKRSGRYEGMIRTKLRARGMPEDLVYLTMIESGFNPNARSPARAVGLWQFIEDTGERYGLRVDGYVDERRDPERSTDAALRYLSDLYAQFGSWNLAAAAYNTGENRVARIMREETGAEAGEENDFWRIRARLPRETRDYVPLIMAAALIGKQPEKYGLGHVERWLPVAADTVVVPGGTRLKVVAEAAGLGEKEVRSLNPQLYRGITPPGESYAVKLPVERVAGFRAGFGRVRAEEAKLAAIEAAKAKEKARLAAAKAKASRRTHRVRSGESLWTIARRYDTSVKALQRANAMGSRSRLRPGQRLAIPS